MKRVVTHHLTPDQAAYYSAKFLAQVAQNLLLAALFIAAATSSQQALGLSSIFVATLVPAAIIGLPAGALVDRMGARHGYVIGAVLRMGAAFGALIVLDAPALAWVIAAAYSTASQVFTPAELAMIPALQRGSAHRAHAILTALQFGGMGFAVLVLAPLLYLLGSGSVFFIIVASVAGFGVVNLLGLWLAVRLRNTEADMKVPMRRAFAPGETIRYFRKERTSGYAVVLLGFKAMASKSMFVGLPIYLDRDVNLGGASILFLLIPGGVGVAAGLALAGWMFNRRGAPKLMQLAFAGIAGSALALAALDYGLDVVVRFSRLRQVAFIEPSIEPTLWVAVPVCFIIGFSFSLGMVSARSVLTSTAPLGQQARVFAAQLWLTDAILILPLILAGIGTEMVGARPMLAILGALGLVALIWMEFTLPRGQNRLIPVEEPAQVPSAVHAAVETEGAPAA